MPENVHPAPRSHLTRRTALASAAWTAPAIVAVSAAPAHAAVSGATGTLTFNPGASFYSDDGFLRWVQFAAHSLVCSDGAEIGPGELTVAITCSRASSHDYNGDPGPSWVAASSTAQGLSTYTWAFLGTIPSTGGSPAFFDNTLWSFDAAGPTPPTFTVNFMAAGYASASAVFTPPGGRSARTAPRPPGLTIPD